MITIVHDNNMRMLYDEKLQKKLFLKILQVSQQSAYVGVSF